MTSASYAIFPAMFDCSFCLSFFTPASLLPALSFLLPCIWKVMKSTWKVFFNWDEEYEKFISQLRDLSKRKKEETLKFHWKLVLAHRKLQTRLQHLKR